LAEAAREGLSIFEYAPASIGALDLYALCWELFELSPEKVRLNVQARAVKPEGDARADASAESSTDATIDASASDESPRQSVPEAMPVSQAEGNPA
jgi:hypothetical protein